MDIEAESKPPFQGISYCTSAHQKVNKKSKSKSSTFQIEAAKEYDLHDDCDFPAFPFDRLILEDLEEAAVVPGDERAPEGCTMCYK
jgi:hypothetical protein